MYSFCNLLLLFCRDYFICESKICLEYKLGFISRSFFFAKDLFSFALRLVAHTLFLTSQWLITCLCSRLVVPKLFNINFRVPHNSACTSKYLKKYTVKANIYSGC